MAGNLLTNNNVSHGIQKFHGGIVQFLEAGMAYTRRKAW